MANSEAISGVQSYLLYGKETTYNTAVSRTLHVGLVTNFKHNINSNMQTNRGLVGTTTGGRKAYSFTAGTLAIESSLDFKATRWDFLEYVLGTASGTGTITYTEANIPPSMTISTNIDNPGSASTDQEVTLSGTVWDSVTIKTSVGEPVMVSASLKSALAVIDTTLSSAVALPSEAVFNFSGASIQLPNASDLTNIVDSLEITIRNNYTMLYGVGSRLARNALPAELDYEIKISLKYLDNALFTAALGATTPTAAGTPTEYADLECTFADGTRSAVFLFGGVPLSDFAQVHELNSAVSEDITLKAKTLTVTYDST